MRENRAERRRRLRARHLARQVQRDEDCLGKCPSPDFCGLMAYPEAGGVLLEHMAEVTTLAQSAAFRSAITRWTNYQETRRDFDPAIVADVVRDLTAAVDERERELRLAGA